MLKDIILFIVAYLLGSINTAIIYTNLLQTRDPRSLGSQNPGATNVLRVVGKKAAAIVFCGDFLKGFIAILLGSVVHLPPALIPWLGLAVVIGHAYPIFFHFQGGKGVATSLGVLYGLSWILASLSLGTWILMLILFKISGLAAIITAIVIPVYTLLLLPHYYFWPLTLMAIFLLWRHKDNIKDLLKKDQN
jgi:glycerol-3-phosphate acyltransferase PlsY